LIELPFPRNKEDTRQAVTARISSRLPCGDDTRQKITEKFTQKADGNFLWAILVAGQVVGRHREDEVKQVIDTMPEGMDALNSQMLDRVVNNVDATGKALSRVWITRGHVLHDSSFSQASERSLSRRAWRPHEHHSLHRVVCGQFVILDEKERVNLVRHSAREYLENIVKSQHSIPFNLASRILIKSCSRIVWKNCVKTPTGNVMCKITPHPSVNSMLPYFGKHTSNIVLLHLTRFLTYCSGFFGGNHDSPLAWMHYLALCNQLSELTNAAQSLHYLGERRIQDVKEKPEEDVGNDSKDSLLRDWATDLARVSAKSSQPLLIVRTRYTHVFPLYAQPHTPFTGFVPPTVLLSYQ